MKQATHDNQPAAVLPHVAIPFGNTSIRIRIPNPARVSVLHRASRDMSERLEQAKASGAGRREIDRLTECQSYATAWIVLQMIDDPSWQIDALDAVERGDFDRGEYPELQYGAAFMDEVHEAAGYNTAAVWDLLNGAAAYLMGSALTDRQAQEVSRTAEHFQAV